jgi:hypothetical protein
MSHPEEEAEEIEDEEIEDDALALADPDDYHRSQRLKEIHKRRQQVNSVLDEIERYTKTDQHNLQTLDLADAVTAYVAELEPVILKTEESPNLPDAMPWDSVHEYADLMGHTPPEYDDAASYNEHYRVFRACNQYLAQVKPLLEEDGTDQWEV